MKTLLFFIIFLVLSTQTYASSLQEKQLLQLASDSSSPMDVKIAAIRGLTRSQDDAVLRFLKSTVENRFGLVDIRIAAIRALREPTDPSVRALLNRISQDSFMDPRERAAAVRSLNGINGLDD